MPNKLKKSCETITQIGKYYLPIMTLCQKMLTIPWCHNNKSNIRFHLFVITWFFRYYMYVCECITCPLLIIYVVYRCRGKYHEKIVGWVTYPQILIRNDFHFHCHQASFIFATLVITNHFVHCWLLTPRKLSSIVIVEIQCLATWENCHQPMSLKSKRETQWGGRSGRQGEKERIKKRKKMKDDVIANGGYCW